MQVGHRSSCADSSSTGHSLDATTRVVHGAWASQPGPISGEVGPHLAGLHTHTHTPCASPPARYLGCANTDCPLCKHNPHKTCPADDNFDEAYADNQVLRARCDADVHVELFNAATGEPFSAPGVEVQVGTGGQGIRGGRILRCVGRAAVCGRCSSSTLGHPAVRPCLLCAVVVLCCSWLPLMASSTTPRHPAPCTPSRRSWSQTT